MRRFETVGDRRLEQIVLAAKVIKRAARTHADGFGDIARRCRVETFFDEKAGGGAQQGFAPVALSGRHRVRAFSVGHCRYKLAAIRVP